MSKTTSQTETRDRRSQKRSAGCAPPACSVILGEKIARDIFSTGNGPHGPCTRIQFMAGDWKTKEIGQGGFCEEALAKAITASLRVHMGARFTEQQAQRRPELNMPNSTPTPPASPEPPLAAAHGSAKRSSAFFMSDVQETVDYVLDQADQYSDQGNFVRTVIVHLKQWKNWKE